MREIKKSHFPYISSKELAMIMLELGNNANYTKAGSYSECCLHGDYAILKTNHIDSNYTEFEKIIKTLNNLKENGVGVARILGYVVTEEGKKDSKGRRYDNGYILLERAKGKELSEYINPMIAFIESENNTADNRKQVVDYSELILHIPQEHVDKYVKDFKAICDAKIKIDPTCNNLFYDDKVGFTFIDLNTSDDISLFDKLDINERNSHRDFLKQLFKHVRNYNTRDIRTNKPIYTPNEEKLIINAGLSFFEKLYNAALKIGITREDIDDFFKDYKCGKKYSKGFTLFGCKSLFDIGSKIYKNIM